MAVAPAVPRPSVRTDAVVKPRARARPSTASRRSFHRRSRITVPPCRCTRGARPPPVVGGRRRHGTRIRAGAAGRRPVRRSPVLSRTRARRLLRGRRRYGRAAVALDRARLGRRARATAAARATGRDEGARARAGAARGLSAVPSRRRPRRLGAPRARGPAARVRRRGREAAREAVGGAPGHALPRLRSRREPQPVRGAALLAAARSSACSSSARRSRTEAASPTRSPTASGSSARRASGACPRTSARRSAGPGCPTSPSRSSTCSPPRRARSSPGPTTSSATGSTPSTRSCASALRLEVDRRILTPALERDDFWWMGFTPREVNNWNPWINSNWLAAALLLERDPARRARAVAKIARSLDRFIDSYPDDGGCDEGPSYWGRAGASLFESLELLHSATGGAVDVYRRAGRPRDRPLHRGRPRRGRLVREHRRRLGPGRARGGARVPLRPRDGRRGPRRVRRLARRAPRRVRSRRRRPLRQPRPRAPRAAGRGRARSSCRRPSRCRARSGFPTCR